MERKDILIEADELLQTWGHENIRIFDASITDDVYRQGHIPGAAFFDHERFSDPGSLYPCTVLPATDLVEQIGQAGISNDAEVIVYAAGMLPYAIRAWWILRYAGHRNVRVLNGGLAAWKRVGGAVDQEPHQFRAAIFEGQFTPGMFAGKEEVLAAVEDERVAIVDVLPRQSYEATHIVGSLCVSCMDLMQGLESLLPDNQLARQLNEMSQYERIITYCGGGIAATVNAVAHLLSGHQNVAVYDGSLQEWLGEGLPVSGTGKWEIWNSNSQEAINEEKTR